jgi:hypothetical protein
LVGCGRRLHRPPLAQRPLATAAAAHGQPLFAVEPLDAFTVHPMPLAAEQHVKAPVSKASALMRQGLEPLAQGRVVRPG